MAKSKKQDKKSKKKTQKEISPKVKKTKKKPLIEKAKKESSKKLAFSSGGKLFELEINLLDRVQTEMFEAIALKPDVRDVEAVRLYVDNLYQVLNKSVTIIMDVKNNLIKKDTPAVITETYNSPA